MDLLTQAVVGAAAGGAVVALRRAAPAGPESLRAAALTGAVAALLADLDVLAGNAGDPIVAQELHRHFTHALLFVPFGALLVAALLRWPLRHRLGTPALFGAACAGLATAGLLDACTGYGTHLLWPFSDARIAWNLVSIIDPLFTLLVAVPLVAGLWRGRARLAPVALACGLGYLLLAAVQHQRALGAAQQWLASGGRPAERLLVRPSFGNILLWRVLVRADGRWHAAAVQVGWPPHPVYPGGSAPAWQPGMAPPFGLPADAVERFARLADGALVIDTAGRRLGDARFAMLPDGVAPMWGLAPEGDGGARWFVDRTLTPAMRARFVAMLRGDDAPPG